MMGNISLHTKLNSFTENQKALLRRHQSSRAVEAEETALTHAGRFSKEDVISHSVGGGFMELVTLPCVLEYVSELMTHIIPTVEIQSFWSSKDPRGSSRSSCSPFNLPLVAFCTSSRSFFPVRVLIIKPFPDLGASATLSEKVEVAADEIQKEILCFSFVCG